MDETEALDVFAALAQPSRLAAFRLLVQAEPDGLAAGAIAQAIEVPQNTMSSHLAVLARAGLVAGERQSRSIVYRAQIDMVRRLASFLVTDCCGGRADLCAPLVAEFTPCCRPEEASR